MEMITVSDLAGVENQLALRILAVARTIAPLDTLEADSARDEAIAILRGVADEARARGSRLVKSQRAGTASVDYSAAESWFSADDRAALRALCGGSSGSSSGPVGQFPTSRLVGRLWPEDYGVS